MYTRSTELYHHGIKGMKWGVRRFQTKDGGLTPAGRKRYADDVSEKKAAYKSANKEYKKAFNKASNRAFAAYSPSKKHRQANDARWEDTVNKAEKANKAQAEYKQAKKTAKEQKRRYNEQLKRDAKTVRKYGYEADFELDSDGNIKFSNYKIAGRKVTEKYIKNVNSKIAKQNLSAVAGTYAVLVGASAAAAILSR